MYQRRILLFQVSLQFPKVSSLTTFLSFLGRLLPGVERCDPFPRTFAKGSIFQKVYHRSYFLPYKRQKRNSSFHRLSDLISFSEIFCRLQRCPSVLHRPVHKLALFIFEIANQPFSFEKNAYSDDLCSHKEQRKSTKHVDGLDSKGNLKSAKARRGNARMGGREESAAILRAQLLSPRPI